MEIDKDNLHNLIAQQVPDEYRFNQVWRAVESYNPVTGVRQELINTFTMIQLAVIMLVILTLLLITWDVTKWFVLGAQGIILLYISRVLSQAKKRQSSDQQILTDHEPPTIRSEDITIRDEQNGNKQ